MPFLKITHYLKKGVATGINRVAMAGLFSDLNNPDFCSILDNLHADCCGLTEPEAQQALADYLKSEGREAELAEKKAEMKYWYNGYNFGKLHDVYNSWSFINYLRRECEPKQYWLGTGSTALNSGILLSQGKL